MPLQRANQQRVARDWLKAFRKQEEEREAAIDRAIDQGANPADLRGSRKIKDLNINYVPPYTPGLLLIPHPERGLIFGYVDFTFQAALSYIIGSVVYLIDSVYMWKSFQFVPSDDANQPSNYLNIGGAAYFIINALLCLWDNYLQHQHHSALNIDFEESSRGLIVADIPWKGQFIDLSSNIFFLIAAVLYVVSGSWWSDKSLPGYDDCYVNPYCTFNMNMFSALCYLISSSFAVWGCFDTWRQRKEDGLPPLKWFSWNFREVDWFAWGDWLYLLASMEPFWQAFMQYYLPDEYGSAADPNDVTIYAMYFADNLLFLIDSILYMIGYLTYIYELRESMRTGTMDEHHEAAISKVVQKITADPSDPETPEDPMDIYKHHNTGMRDIGGGGMNQHASAPESAGVPAGGRKVMKRASLQPTAARNPGRRASIQDIRSEILRGASGPSSSSSSSSGGGGGGGAGGRRGGGEMELEFTTLSPFQQQRRQVSDDNDVPLQRL